MKKTVLKIIFGIVITIAIMAIGFYFFLFLNPLHIYEENLLKWIPILIGVIGMFFSGLINKKTPPKFLPFLFLPFFIFDLFGFLYIPFIFILIIIGSLTLAITRDSIKKGYRFLSGLGVLGVFFYFLFSQPLIVLTENSDYNDHGELINANTLWDFTEKGKLILPDHTLYDQKDIEFNLKNIKEKTYLITFWATWCPPCMHEKPELEKLKKELSKNSNIEFIDISFDSDIHKWKQFVNDKNPIGMQFISKRVKETRRVLQISSIPMHFIVGEDGVYSAYSSFEIAKKELKRLSVKN
ncbi:TlpA family protein disulfide reductase [Aquimarina algiphila]|uniref:TlpA family protein disulfide reductase n=1 Tax=Aquimarina algiphila TaxID=2047982 RepID=UPI0024918CB1|nr:TlpA disulfide reductase family protein [Aquimarina algiphila]